MSKSSSTNSVVTVTPYKTLSFSNEAVNEKVTELDVRVSIGDKEHECFHLVVVKLVQGYTLTKADREDTASIALDLELFKEIFEESKKIFTDIEVLHTNIPLFI